VQQQRQPRVDGEYRHDIGPRATNRVLPKHFCKAELIFIKIQFYEKRSVTQIRGQSIRRHEEDKLEGEE
jgi:hypothetical protein